MQPGWCPAKNQSNKIKTVPLTRRGLGCYSPIGYQPPRLVKGIFISRSCMDNNTLLSILGSKSVSFYSIFAKALGSVPAAVMLSQAFFWQEKAKHKSPVMIGGEAFFCKTADDWFEETGITEDQQKTVRSVLCGLGILIEKRHGLPAKMHFRIDMEITVAVISRYLNTGVKVPVDYRKQKRETTRTSSGKFRQLDTVINGDTYRKESEGESRREFKRVFPDEKSGSLFTDDFTDIPKEKKPRTSKPKSEGNKKTSPGAAWTSKAVDSFNRVLIECQEGTPEHERLTFNWRAAEGRNFQSLKKIREAMGPDMRMKLNRELLEDDFEKGFEFLFRYGFQYMKKIADEKGGPIQFSPASILNNYNSILQYARTGHKAQQPKLRPGEIDRDTFYTELVRESLAMDYK